ncbi:MAG: energy-coupling factor transporter transmembrane protein EcfT [Clostridia bacterium]|nr:energy-coupling factor transporter transmembrane protein EcfT [Clostridia bacterium]
MKRLDRLDPRALFLWFICCVGPAAVSPGFLVALICFSGALSFWITSGTFSFPKLAASAFFPLMLAMLNPLINHDGLTVLFFFNNSPVTLESVLYGALTGFVISSVIIWFGGFSVLMTSDKWLVVLSVLSAKFALVVSMSLRFVPAFAKKLASVRRTQKALGLYSDENVIDRIKGEMKVFSILVTWALEHGVVTADSMEARGYGCARRTYFSDRHFSKNDAVFCAVTVILAALVFFCSFSGKFATSFFPFITFAKSSAYKTLGLVFYAVICHVPLFFGAAEKLKRTKFKLQAEV